jgi:hypothetical protein
MICNKRLEIDLIFAGGEVLVLKFRKKDLFFLHLLPTDQFQIGISNSISLSEKKRMRERE